MTAVVLADALGPRARRRVQLLSAAAAVVVVGGVALILKRLFDHGELAADKWQGLTDPRIVRFLYEGLKATLQAAFVAMALALVAGALLALGRLARSAPVRWASAAYIEFFRGFPLLLAIFFSALALPRYGVNLPIFWYLVIALVAYNSAVLGEIFRAGILSLERGQFEAASAIGLGYWQSMMLVVVPQALRRMIPAIVSQVVTLLKDTALGYVIGFEELLRRAQIVGEISQIGRPLFQALAVAAAVYILVNFALSRLARRLEVRQRQRYRAGGIAVAGVEDLTAVGVAADAVVGGRGSATDGGTASPRSSMPA